MDHARKCQQNLPEGPSSYYIVGSLGNGATSNGFHALDSEGKEVALKVYVKHTNANGTVMSKEKFEKVAEASVNREAENFNSIYNDLKAEEVKLSGIGRWCVVMPFFRPIEKAKRRGNLEKIQEALRKLEVTGLKYRDDDVRWRHVGLYKESCILFDLADLEKVRPDDTSFVKGHHDVLENRIEKEPVAEEKLFKIETPTKP
ncbi:unknown protein [Seminavis robusta]|uniref:DUF5898 domain-containing protein n=1 Tax=Seminavis robusta TaxID=568900 RepID=A0A9N8EUW2_9STRA|nr:unknown protein [Seminavis robusta]|eukprot:Sro1689_g291290.1 n/a (202) ;mRNA; f:9471-10076